MSSDVVIKAVGLVTFGRMLKLSTATSKAKEDILCQNCLQYGHWSYECKNPPKNASRMSRMQKIRSKKYQPKFNEDPGPDVPKNNFLYDTKRFGERERGEMKDAKMPADATKRKVNGRGRAKVRDTKRSRRRSPSESSSSSSSSSSSDSESDSDSSSESDSSSSSSSDSSRSPSRSRRRSSKEPVRERRSSTSSPKRTSRRSDAKDIDAWRKARDDAQAGPRQRQIERPPSSRDRFEREKPRGVRPVSPKQRRSSDDKRRKERPDSGEEDTGSIPSEDILTSDGPPAGSPRWFEISLSPSRGSPPEAQPDKEEASGG
ncbi:hypothetical protein FOL47_008226, partial [Perkinsus chesapeaki]